MAQKTAAGSKIYISDASNKVAANAAAYAALTFLEIGEVTNLGEFGKQYQDITTNTINQRQTKHGKGAFDEGTLELQVYFDPDDVGQDEVAVALDSDDEWAFKITLNDQITPSTGNPTTFYFRALVMSFRKAVSDVNSMVTARIQIAINSPVVPVAAA